ncbi:hypothetical protein C2E20_5812 [Micractinium conductrix]|uniref:Uncharacterized protein n=1 Tax=Micractinium conductrix TaxID=554055 RepID=A0A2P6V9F7_9CHLO|nr:hypothetical protein C2E20_5812 [Micractinium conductrix]|eukprot:PSC70711.1 hypothetical protein C2E20_5812 [Micractinium conductrix]
MIKMRLIAGPLQEVPRVNLEGVNELIASTEEPGLDDVCIIRSVAKGMLASLPESTEPTCNEASLHNQRTVACLLLLAKVPLVDASEASRLLEVLCTLRARRPDLVHEVDVCVLASMASLKDKLRVAMAPGQHTAALQAMATLARNLTADGDDAGNNLFLQAAKIVSKTLMCWRAFVCDVMEDCAEAACKVAAPKPTKPEEVALWHRTRVGSAGALAPLLRALDPYGGLELESRLGRANVASLFDLYRWLWLRHCISNTAQGIAGKQRIKWDDSKHQFVGSPIIDKIYLEQASYTLATLAERIRKSLTAHGQPRLPYSASFKEALKGNKAAQKITHMVGKTVLAFQFITSSSKVLCGKEHVVVHKLVLQADVVDKELPLLAAEAAKLAAFLEESRIAAAVEGRAPLAAADLATLQGLASAVTAHAALLSYVGPPLDTWEGGAQRNAFIGCVAIRKLGRAWEDVAEVLVELDSKVERKSLALGSKLAGWTRTLNPPGEKDAVTGDHLAATVAPFVLDRFKETAAKDPAVSEWLSKYTSGMDLYVDLLHVRDDDSLIDLGAATHLELLSYLNNIMQAIGISSKALEPLQLGLQMSWTPAKVSAMAHLNNATHELLVYAVPAMIKLSPTDKAAVEALVGKVHTHLQERIVPLLVLLSDTVIESGLLGESHEDARQLVRDSRAKLDQDLQQQERSERAEETRGILAAIKEHTTRTISQTVSQTVLAMQRAGLAAPGVQVFAERDAAEAAEALAVLAQMVAEHNATPEDDVAYSTPSPATARAVQRAAPSPAPAAPSPARVKSSQQTAEALATLAQPKVLRAHNGPANTAAKVIEASKLVAGRALQSADGAAMESVAKLAGLVDVPAAEP